MSICRIASIGFSLLLLAGSTGLCQPPQPTTAGNFKYAHTAYPTTSYPPATGVSPQSEWTSDKESQLLSTPADRSAPANGEIANKATSKPSTGGVPSFRKWFSRSAERPSKKLGMPPTASGKSTPATRDRAAALVAPPTNGSARNKSANQQTRELLGENQQLAAPTNGMTSANDHPPSAISNNSNDSSPSSVMAAFSGILSEDPLSGSVQTVQGSTAKPNQVPSRDGAGPKSLISSGAKQAVATSKSAENPLNRPKIIFQPVAGGVDGRGNALLRPSVQVAEKDANPGDGEIRLTQFLADDTLPPPEIQQAPESAYPINDEWMPPVVADDCETCSDGYGSGNFGHGHGLGHRHGRGPGYAGVGREYVMHAPFFIDRSEPYNNCFIRGDAAANWEFPDRAEYFWAKTPDGKGPPDPLDQDRGEPSVNYQDIVFSIERGGERFSVATDIPIRAVDPEFRGATTGLADMEVTSKIVLLDGCRFQLTQLFSTHLPTGSFRRGTGNGHVSLEPGVAYRYKWNELTYIHGDLTYLFPIAADPFFSGQILNYGIGISHVWIDADTYALIPTFEVDAWTVLDGRQTLPGNANPASEEVDSIGIVNVHPGLRWVCDKGGDCGVKEFGISSGICVTQDSWYEELLRIEFRWSR